MNTGPTSNVHFIISWYIDFFKNDLSFSQYHVKGKWVISISSYHKFLRHKFLIVILIHSVILLLFIPISFVALLYFIIVYYWLVSDSQS